MIKKGSYSRVRGHYDELQTHIIYLIISLIGYVEIYILQDLLTNEFPLAEYGKYAVIGTIIFLVSKFLMLGLEQGIFIFLPQYFNNGETRKIKGFLVFSLLILTATSVLLILFSLGVRMLTRGPTADSHLQDIACFLWMAIFMIISKYLTNILVTIQLRNTSFIVSNIIQVLFFMLAIIIFFYFFSLNLVYVLLVLAISFMFSIMIQTAFVRVKLRRIMNTSIKTDLRPWKSWLKHSLINMIRYNLQYLIMTIPLLIVKYSGSIDMDHVGIFALITTVFVIPMFIIMNMVSSSVLPVISKLYALGEYARFSSLLRKTNIFCTFSGIIFFFIVILFGRHILSSFNASYSKGYLIAVIMSGGYAINQSTIAIRLITSYLGLDDFMTKTIFFILLIEIVTGFACTVKWGMLGMAVVYITITTANGLFSYISVKKILNQRPGLDFIQS